MSSQIAEAEPGLDLGPMTAASPESSPLGVTRRQTVLALLATVVLLLIHTIGTRYSINPDGISYLDISDEVRRRGLSALIHGYWSPVYPALLSLVLGTLEPSMTREVEVVHWLGAVMFIAAMAAYWYFVVGVRARLAGDDSASLASASWFPIFALVMFWWHSLVQIDLMLLTPDLLLAVWVLLMAGIICRLPNDRAALGTHALLGVIAGVAYLTKGALFLFGPPFLLASAFAARLTRHKLQRALVALAAFATVTTPFIVALSEQKGRLTFNEVGGLAWAWMVNDVPRVVHWQGGPPGFGTPVHPTRQVFSNPNAFEFATPVAGSYPPWYDASYWYEGVRPRIDVARLARLTWQNAYEYATWLTPVLIIGLVLVMLRGASAAFADVRRTWMLWVPALLPLGAYGLVYTESRYVAAFIAIVIVAGVGAIRVTNGAWGERLRNALLCAALLAYVLPVVRLTIPRALTTYSAVVTPHVPHKSAAAAQALADAGVPAGTKFVYVGFGYDAYWPRLARGRIVGEIPEAQIPIFWSAPPARQDSALASFKGVGATVAVAGEVPTWADTRGWQPLAETGFFYRLLETPNDSAAAAR